MSTLTALVGMSGCRSVTRNHKSETPNPSVEDATLKKLQKAVAKSRALRPDLGEFANCLGKNGFGGSGFGGLCRLE